MKKSIVISMALFAFAFGANASVVSIAQAQKAAQSWLVREGKASSPQASVIQRADVIRLAGHGEDAKYYAIKIQGGGTVVTSSDDTASPVVLFTDKNEMIDFSDVNSPAYALLSNDYRTRIKADAEAAESAKKPQISSGYRFYLNRQRMLQRNRAEWEKLSGDGYDGDSLLKSTLAWYGRDDWFIKIYTANSLYDTRISPLIQSRWSQSTVGGQACYNFYTPNEKDPEDAFGYMGSPDNAVCGCVATALAQVLRYFEFDYEVNTNKDYDCTYTSITGREYTVTRKLQGDYDWDKMSLAPGLDAVEGKFSVTNAMEIGKLCADCGAAVHMMYTKESSGAYSDNAYKALTQVFGYSGARWYDGNGGAEVGTHPRGSKDIVEPEAFPETRAAALQRVFYSNFDAGLPVLLGLTGHEVVADGYGYSKDGLDYVHINMGWGGQCDLWYLLPNVSCDSNGRPEGNLMFFEDCAYNIFTTNAPSDTVMSGRVVDDDNDPIAGATVKICRPGDYENPIAEFVTGENGIWGLIIAPGTYEVVASDELVTEVESFTVAGGDNGNRWGCDIMLAPPAVRNLMQSAPTNEYTSLEKAIRAANTNDVLEVFDRTRLKKNVTIDRDLTIRITDAYADDPTNCIIRVSNSSVITVAPGVRAEFDGLAFKSDSKTVIDVATNAVAAFSGKLGVGTVHTADTNGFEVCGAVDFIDGFELRVDCDEAKADGDRFGVWTCSAADKDTANRVLNPWNLDLGGIAKDDGTLVWGVVAVDPRIAVAYIDDGSGTPVYYRTLDNLFRNLPEGDLDIKITQDANGLELKEPVDVTGRKILISSEGGAFSISGIAAKTGGFIVGEGGELTFENIEINGFDGEWFVRIPEEGGTFTIGENVWMHDLHAVGADDPGEYPNGLIVMLGGIMKMDTNSLLSGCSYQNGLGSVIALYGGMLDIDGASIIGCSAEMDGGAIRFEPLSESAELRLSGHVDISGNLINGVSSSGCAGDICLVSDAALITVVGELTTDYGIGVCGMHCDISNVFGTVTGPVFDPEVFFRDGNDKLEKPLAAVLSGGDLLWDYAKETYGQCDPDDATVLVTYTDSGEELYYDNIATALNNIHADALIELTADQYLNTDAVVGYKVTIDGWEHRIVREGPGEIKVVSGGDLTLENVTITGYDVDHPWDYYVLGGWYLFADFRGSDHQIIEVDGGRLTLGDGTEICLLGHDQVVDRLWDYDDPYFYSIFVEEYGGDLWPYGAYIPDDYYRASCAVVAWNGAEVVMENGAVIHDCWNMYYDDPVNCSATAGILIEASTAYLRGGSISGCVSAIGPAVDVCQGVDEKESVVYLGGGFTCNDNTDIDGAASSFRLEDLSKLYLESEFTGKLGYTSGYFANTNRATEVITNLTETEVSSSAVNFRNDVTGAIGVGVSSDAGEGYLVVWSTCIDADGKFYEVNDDGTTNVWTLIGEMPEPPDPPDPPEPTYIVTTNVPTAIAFTAIVRSNDVQTCTVTIADLVKDANYSVYTVTSLDGGFDVGTLTPVTNFNAEADGPFTLTVPSTSPALFWKASGKTTYITNYLGGATQE